MPAEIVDTTAVSLTFPDFARGSIPREHVVDTVLQLFEEQGAELVLVEGADGIGKTTLLAQVALQTADSGISVFIRPLSSLATDPSYLMQDLADQARFILFGEPKQDERVTEAEFRTLISGLETFARRTSDTGHVTVVVDGLADFEASQIATRDELVWKVLPFGRPGFRFLVSGSADVLPASLQKELSVRHIQVPLFSLAEAQQLFADVELDAEIVDAIYRESRKMPGLMASYLREIRAGRSPVELLENAPTDLQGYVAREWSGLRLEGLPGTIAGLIAYAQRPYSLGEAASVVGSSVEELKELLIEIPPLTVRESGVVEYVTEAHRKYAIQTLKSRRNEILDLIIARLLEGDGSQKQDELVSYLRIGGRLAELVAATTGDFLVHSLGESGSFLPALGHARNALEAAITTNANIEVFRLALLRSTLLELDSSSTLKPHIDALTALGDFDEAIAAAQRAPIVEDRVVSLAAICSKLKESDAARFEALKTQVEAELELLLQSNDTISERRLGELVKSTLEVSPELAYRVVEYADDRSSQGQRISSRSSTDGEPVSLEEEPYEQSATSGQDIEVADRTMLRAVTQFSRRKTVSELFDLTATLSANRQLFFLLWWLESARGREGAIDVVERCITLLVSSDMHTPTARDFSVMAGALGEYAAADAARAADLVQRIDALSQAARGRSQTAAIVRLDLNLFRAEMRRSRTVPRSAVDRLARILAELHDVHDAPTRAHGLALVYAALLDEVAFSESSADYFNPIVEVIAGGLRDAVEKVLSSSAEHFDLLRATLVTLARAGSSLAEDIGARLNTELRRDLAFARIAAERLENGRGALSLDGVLNTIEKGSRKVARELESMRALEVLARGDRDLPSDTESALRKRFETIRSWSDPVLSARAFAASAVVLDRIGSELANRTATLAVDFVGKISDRPMRILVGYRVAGSIAGFAPALARNLVEELDQLRVNDALAAPSVQGTMWLLGGLAIRALGGVVSRKAVPSGAVDQVIALVEQLDAKAQRLAQYADLAATYMRFDDMDKSSKLLEQYVIPELHRLDDLDEYTRVACLIDVLPALYATHQDVAVGFLESLPWDAREEAIDNICTYMFYRVLRQEPVSRRSPELIRLSYPTALKILGVLALSGSDEVLERHCRRVCLSATKLRGGTIMTREQQRDLAGRIDQLAKEKLPSSRGIQHDGYTILLAGMAAALNNVGGEAWSILARRAESIPNESDRVFVLATLVELMPNRLNGQRKEFLTAAIALVPHIGSTLDSIDRYEVLAQAARTVDTRISRECIQAAVDMAGSGISGPVNARLRSILDLAYAVDSAFAERLAAHLDDDPARNRRTSRAFGEHIGVLKARDGVGRTGSFASQADMPIRQVVSLARTHFASLNAGRIAPISTDRTVPFIARAGQYPLRRVEAVYSWAVHNESLRSSTSAEFLTQVISSCDVAAAVVRGVASVSFSRDQRARRATEAVIGRVSQMIALPGSRDRVEDVVRDFARTEVGEFIKIADPYFGPSELSILRIVLEERPDCRIEVMTSRGHQRTLGIADHAARHYRDHWRTSISDGQMPDLDVYVVSLGGTGKSPIHDRWMLTDNSGLRFGTSINTIGRTKVSEISEIDAERTAELVQLFDAFASRRLREQEGQRIAFEGFSLRDEAS